MKHSWHDFGRHTFSDIHRHSILCGPQYGKYAIGAVHLDRDILSGVYSELPFYYPLDPSAHAFTSQSLEPIDAWCDKNVNGMWYRGWHCVRWSENEWRRDEYGGIDTIFYAFELEADAILFKLRW